MVFVRKNGPSTTPAPDYDPNSPYLSLILHFGGHFENNKYVGGDSVVVEGVRADLISYSDLDDYSNKVGVKGNRRYQLQLRDMCNFKLLIDDDDIRNFLNSFLDVREVHVFVELLENLDDDGYESFEDPDFIIGNEITDDEGDNRAYEENVEEISSEFHGINPANIVGGSVWVDLEGTSKPGGNAESEVTSNKGKAPVESETSGNESGSEADDEVVEGGDDFDEGRLSEEDNESPCFPAYNPKSKFNPEFVLEQTFSTKQEFKVAAQSHAIMHKRSINFPKNDDRRVYAVCADSECKWRIHLLKMKNEESWQIRRYYKKHSCASSNEVKNCTSTWLSERFLQRFQSDKKRSVSGFMLDVHHDIKVHVSKQQAYRAKHKAILRIEGDPDVQYSKLWSYVDELRKTNPGSTIILGTENSEGVVKFDRFYACFDGVKKGFLGGCRPILGVDGCHLKGKYGGMLLTAVGVDPNNNLYPVAYAVVDKETGEIWEWFLTVLKRDLGIQDGRFTFVSDKQKGLLHAFESVFPRSENRFCVRYLHNNFKNVGFRGLAYKHAMWKAACSTTQADFKLRMEEMRLLNEEAWKWFHNKPPEQWCKAYFSEHTKCDMLLNNVCESFNSNILDARDKAIITMLEWLREHMMKRLQKNRDRARARWKGRICPRIKKIMERNLEKVGNCIPLKCNDTHYQVSCYDGGQYTVQLDARTCSCRSWQLTGIPCIHGICALLKQKLDPEEYVDDYYTVEMYHKAYEHSIFGISHDELWGDTLYIPPLPSDFGKKPNRGRPPTLRRKEPDEKELKQKKRGRGRMLKMKRQQITVKCRNCGEAGHNAGGCSKPKSNNNPDQDGEPKRKKVAEQTTGKVAARRGRKKKQLHVDTDSPRMAPPNGDNSLIDEEMVPEMATQQSQVTSASPYFREQSPRVQGPTMYEQLQMGNSGMPPLVPQMVHPPPPPPMVSRLNVRAPPPFTGGQFNFMSTVQIQNETSKKIYFDSGKKFMELSSQEDCATSKGKKKA